MVSAVSKEVESTRSPEQLSSILRSRPLSELVTPLLKADAKSFTNAPEFISRNTTFFTTAISRPPYTPIISDIPILSLHTASAALTLVPNSHWAIETHKFNISSYDGASTILENTPPPGDADFEKSRVAADKKFKKELYHYLRWALSAGAPGPGIPETMVILGREETVKRLAEARELTREAEAGLSPVAARRAKERGAKAKQSVPDEAGQDRSWMGSLAPRG